MHFDQRPKLEDYDDHLFIVTHGFGLLSNLNKVWNRIESDATATRGRVDFIRYLIADAVVDAIFPVVDQLALQIEEIEERLMDNSSSRSTLKEMLRLKRLLVSLRRVLPTQRDVLSQMSKREGVLISEKTTPYFRDVYDHLLRINESVELNRELLGNVFEGFQWLASQRTNDIMKRLTIVIAIFLPLTFITG